MELGRLKYDILFKKVFLKKHILKAFLNTVLESELPAPIIELSYEPTDFILQGTSRLIQQSKHSVIDVFCQTAENNRILIELQKGSDKRALPRFLDYQCRNYSSQFSTGTDYAVVMPCYSICWFFDLKPPHKSVKEIISLQSNRHHTDWIFAWEIIALYPRNIPKTHIEQKHIDKLEEWLLLDVIDEIKDAKKVLQLIQTDEVREAFETLDLSDLSEEQLRRMLFDEQIRQDYHDIYAEHIQHEKQEEKRAIARQLLDVLDVKTISQKTGLSVVEIEQLKEV